MMLNWVRTISIFLLLGASTLHAKDFHVKDYGAKGDGKSDDGPAIRKADAIMHFYIQDVKETQAGLLQVQLVDNARKHAADLKKP